MRFVRWGKYGQSRLYVTDDAGAELGWWDLKTDQPHPASPRHLEALKLAVLEWKFDQPPPRHSLPGGQRRSVSGDGDLLANLPGTQLAPYVAAAHEAGEVPTAWRRARLGKHAYSSWERGAIGERLVAAKLHELHRFDGRWGYLNSIPLGEQGDIDHFVVGPGGVFTINAKHHAGCNIWVAGNTLMVNGKRQDHVRSSRREAQAAARRLTRALGSAVHTVGLVVPVEHRSLTVREQPEGVAVVAERDLIHFLRAQGDVLQREQVERIFACARRETTWATR